jgi:hypothetical protein
VPRFEHRRVVAGRGRRPAALEKHRAEQGAEDCTENEAEEKREGIHAASLTAATDTAGSRGARRADGRTRRARAG